MAIEINWELPVTFKTFIQLQSTEEILTFRVTLNWQDILAIQEYVYSDIMPDCLGKATLITTTGPYVTSEDFEKMNVAWKKYKQYVYNKSNFIDLSAKNN